MGKTKIPYADENWSVVTGCTPVGPACTNCWARGMAERLPKTHAGWEDCPACREFREGLPGCNLCNPVPFSRVTCHPDRLDAPLHWRKSRVVAVSLMGDLFHEDVPSLFIDDVWAMMEGSSSTFVVLTKRPHNIAAKLYGSTEQHPGRLLGGGDYLPNVWLGVSVWDQDSADRFIPILLDTPAAHRFVSLEPLLGEVDVRPHMPLLGERCWDGGTCHHECTPETGCFRKQWCGQMSDPDPLLDLVIAGCESGPKRRPAPHDWFRSLAAQCAEAGVPYFLKQMGEREDGTGRVIGLPELDGQRHDALPWR